jgi:Fic family protein
LQEAKDVYKFVESSPELSFLSEKMKAGKKLTRKDYEKLEFFNIAKTFRQYNASDFKLKDLDDDLIKELHNSLTRGLDVFKEYLIDFDVYRSGKWRNNNKIHVGTYKPASYKDIPKGINWLIRWIKDNPSITNIGLFHTGLYALHPFSNGNKRTCRIIEHLLFRLIGLNSKNLYSTSYYYHKEKDLYIKYLLYSIERKNLNHFTSLVQEALVLSIVEVIKTSLESQRSIFLARQEADEKVISVIKPLVKRREMQYKDLWKRSKKKMSNKTFVGYLLEAVEDKIVIRREEGRRTYYKLNVNYPEEELLKAWLGKINKNLLYVPDRYKLV